MDDLLDKSLDIVNETLDQLTGRSRKKWALMLVAFIAGAAVAAYFIRKQLAASGTSPRENSYDAMDRSSETIAGSSS